MVILPALKNTFVFKLQDIHGLNREIRRDARNALATDNTKGNARSKKERDFQCDT